MSWGWGWRPYVPVAQRRAQARREAQRLIKKGGKLEPIEICGRAIATTFWGNAWCDNLERYSDFANRLPRGRTYVRNGSVVDLKIQKGQVKALVSGSELYKVSVQITPLARPTWKKIKQDCSRSIDSLIDLLQGRFSQGVMQRLTRQEDGLFPQPQAIKMSCSCPDWAVLCKHVAAVLYGIGARLDQEPQLLFTLRDLDHLELIGEAVSGDNLDQALGADQPAALANEDLGELFGIELDQGAAPVEPPPKARRRRSASANSQPAAAEIVAAPAACAPRSKSKPKAPSASRRKVATASARSVRQRQPAKRRTAAG
jgi:uncharacterized Zn finger protein